MLASAARLRRGRELAAEAAALEADEVDRAEMLEVASLMESLRAPIHVAGETTRVLVEQLGAVDAQRLGDRVGLLSAEEMWAVDDALVTCRRSRRPPHVRRR